jgi:cephalosporin hydroxylase
MKPHRSHATVFLAAIALFAIALPVAMQNQSEAEQQGTSQKARPKQDEAEKDKARPSNAELFGEQMSKAGKGLTRAEELKALKDFLRVWSKHKPVFKSTFMGVRTYQNPLDAWVVQEVIVQTTPDVIVETGTAKGGSSLLWAMILREVNPDGRVITIDIADQREERAKQHAIAKERIDFLLGGSTDPKIVGEVRRRVAGKRVLVLLDSLHTKEHIADEIAAYAPLVTVGSYLIVQDTPFGGVAAINEFLATNDQFVVDSSRERFVLTNSMRGYLKRVR